MILAPLSARAAWAARLNAVTFLDSAKAWALLEALGPEGLSAGGAADWAASGGGFGPSRPRDGARRPWRSTSTESCGGWTRSASA